MSWTVVFNSVGDAISVIADNDEVVFGNVLGTARRCTARTAILKLALRCPTFAVDDVVGLVYGDMSQRPPYFQRSARANMVQSISRLRRVLMPLGRWFVPAGVGLYHTRVVVDTDCNAITERSLKTSRGAERPVQQHQGV